jgi:dipeptidyl aminopeptidase/acylaminoacyl peptidase
MALSRRPALLAIAGLAATPFMARPALSSEPALRREDYARARLRFRTHLLTHGPAPDGVLPLDPPEGASRIAYQSDGRSLAAWLSNAPQPKAGRSCPAVLVLHGGNVLGAGHWELARPFIDAGYVALIPSLRGENGQAGDFSGFYDETADVLAAADVLRADPRVDPNRLHVAGHSVGGTQTLLAAISASVFRAAASFSAAPDATLFFRRFPQMIVFDASNPAEFEMRSALCYAGSFKCPLRIWHGLEEARPAKPSRATAERARAAGLDVMAGAFAGGHSSALPAEIVAAISFFQSTS